MEDASVVFFILAMLGLAMGCGWLLGVRQGTLKAGDDYYSAYSDGYNNALNDMEEVAKAREAKEKAKKAKKATPKRKVRK